MRLYGECRNMGDHRNDNPAWTELTDLLSGTMLATGDGETSLQQQGV